MKTYTIYVTEEIARKVMEKGFECLFIGKYPDWVKDYGKCFNSDPTEDKRDYWYTPTAEQICGWLREEKNIDIELCIDWADETPIGYCYDILLNKRKMASGDGKTYNIALHAAINKALDLIRQ